MQRIEKRLGYKFKEKHLLQSALHHSSVKGCSIPFERLEFLGDRVLGLVIADHIYKTTKGTEGKMAKRHSAFVCAETCKEVAIALELDQVIRVADGQLAKNKTVLADAMEALLGALYIDADYKTVKTIILAHWDKIFDSYDESKQDPKTRLQEVVQKVTKEAPTYEILSATEKNGIHRFEVTVKALANETIGVGHSRKEAEIDAARLMLVKLGK